MANSGRDRRQFERIPFSNEEKMRAFFLNPADNTTQLIANLLNISEGGLGISFKRDEFFDKLKPGDKLLLQEAKSIRPIQFSGQIDTEIRWIYNDTFFDQIVFGIQFLDIPESIQEQIRQFVKLALQKK